jgi:hypothetical protein
MGAITRLQAVNRMLSAVGEAIVLVEQSGRGDYANCSSVLDAVTLEVAIKGYEFNTRVAQWSPDSNGNILLPGGVLRCRTTDPNSGIFEADGRLYNKVTNTDVFTGPVEVEYVTLPTFENLPTPIQIEVRERAARRYQKSYVGSAQTDQMLREDESVALGVSEAAQSESENYNMFDDNPDLGWLRRRTFTNGTIL